MRIAVIGAGGLGGYFGGRWAAAGLDVTFVARGASLEALSARPLEIASPLGDVSVPVKAVGDPAELEAVDLVVVATKTWQLDEALSHLPPLLGPETVVVGVQNGVEAPGQIASAAGRERTMGGTCRIIAFLEAPGRVRHVGVQPVFTFGELGGGTSERGERIRAALELGEGLVVRHSPDVVLELWKKLLFFAPVSGVGASVQVPVGDWRAVPETRAKLVAAMREVIAVAAARGIELPEEGIDKALAFLDHLPTEGTTSLQRDVRDVRRTELEALCGSVARYGRELGVPVPVHEALYALLLPRELAARHRHQLELPAALHRGDHAPAGDRRAAQHADAQGRRHRNPRHDSRLRASTFR